MCASFDISFHMMINLQSMDLCVCVCYHLNNLVGYCNVIIVLWHHFCLPSNYYRHQSRQLNMKTLLCQNVSLRCIVNTFLIKNELLCIVRILVSFTIRHYIFDFQSIELLYQGWIKYKIPFVLRQNTQSTQIHLRIVIMLRFLSIFLD